jgi:hypothetical protein
LTVPVNKNWFQLAISWLCQIFWYKFQSKLIKIIIRNGAKTISLPNVVWETYCFCSVSLFGRLIVFAPFLIIIFIITSPRLLSGDVLLFYVKFLFHYYYYSYYYYVTPNAVGWRIAILHFFFTIIIILIIILPHIFVCSISRRCLDQTLWNLVGISYAMWSCAGKGWFFLSKWLPLSWKRPKC